MEGWIKLHRQILDWEWYTDYPVRILFEHLLLTANFADKKWRGQLIKRGQLITSRQHLAKQTGLSEQQVRTAIDKLKSTNNITTKSTSEYTLVTIENYEMYQMQDEISTNKITNKATNKQPTNNHNVRKKEYIYNILNKYKGKFQNNFYGRMKLINVLNNDTDFIKLSEYDKAQFKSDLMADKYQI